MEEYKIKIRDTPCPLNRLLAMHWGARKRIKGRFNRAVWAAVSQAKLPKDWQDPPKKVHIDMTVYWGASRGRLPDPDALIKHTWDCLKDNGVIYDDSQKWLSWSRPIIERDTDNPRTEIIVRVIK